MLERTMQEMKIVLEAMIEIESVRLRGLQENITEE
jgi:hypothetical protein